MSNNREHFRADEFCSRKLWQLINRCTFKTESDRRAAINELALRQHYLPQLQAMDISFSQTQTSH